MKQPSDHHVDVLSGRRNDLTMQSVLFFKLESLKSVALFAFLYFSMRFPVGVPRFPRLAAIHGRLRTHRSDTSQGEPSRAATVQTNQMTPALSPPSEVHSVHLENKPFSFSLFLSISFFIDGCSPLTNTPSLSSTFIFSPLSEEDQNTMKITGEQIWATSQPEHLCWCYRMPTPHLLGTSLKL